MRALPALALALLLLPGAGAQAPESLPEPVPDPPPEVEDKAQELHSVARQVVQQGDAPSLGQAVQRAIRGAEPEPGPGAGPAADPSQPEGPVSAALLALLGLGALFATALGFRHLHQRNVLEHAGRAAILALVRQQPGMHLRAIARAAAQPVQQAEYHLRVLERLGLVASQELAGRKCYHESGVGADVRRALAQQALAPGPAAQRVLDFVAAHPGASQSEVARQLGMLPGAARWHLRRLAAQGTLEEARQGKALVYRAHVAAPQGPGPGR